MVFAVQGAHVIPGLSKVEQDTDLCKTWDAQILQTCEFLMTLKSRNAPEIEVHVFII